MNLWSDSGRKWALEPEHTISKLCTMCQIWLKWNDTLHDKDMSISDLYQTPIDTYTLFPWVQSVQFD